MLSKFAGDLKWVIALVFWYIFHKLFRVPDENVNDLKSVISRGEMEKSPASLVTHVHKGVFVPDDQFWIGYEEGYHKATEEMAYLINHADEKRDYSEKIKE